MIIFMGVAGAGKSLQGKMLADKAALPWLSTGEFLRMLVAGEERRKMLSGKLLDDDEIIRLVEKIFKIVDTDHEFILDGFPRTLHQASWLLNSATGSDFPKISVVININVSEAVVKSRLMSRGRLDDNASAIEKRFNEYHEVTKPIIEEFKKAGVRVVEIDGEQQAEIVHNQIMSSLETVV